ncbi:hypothetical protein BLA39750_01084 [Burkholderia lata]|uniref:Uncharacterized protein n=1 Tax=Burkholderia lata (strain ATCC 17760 / DSM 23089 / LMG 22485 / NCIMB 9086 / R18194 / 383) TaxID=482957 RepID=A0A6P2UQJ5_BURL3|nr:hypothetical protein [Burkholderia lata]VWC79401.1 hypothetical protein BLA39750_01084 [Burkholderia lata]
MKPKVLTPISFIVCLVAIIASAKIPHGGLAAAMAVAAAAAAGFSFLWYLCTLIGQLAAPVAHEDKHGHKRIACICFSVTMSTLCTAFHEPIGYLFIVIIWAAALSGLLAISGVTLFVESLLSRDTAARNPDQTAKI